MTNYINIDNPKYFPWKGKTFSQITSVIKLNTPIENPNKSVYFHPHPLKISRREIASQTIDKCNSRKSISIDGLNRPNGYLISGLENANTKGLVNTLDINYPNSLYETNNSVCNQTTNCINQANNARRRVRSAGVIKKNFHTNSSQYLHSRNMTFEQNQFNYNTSGSLDKASCGKIIPTVKPNNAIFKQQGAATASAWVGRRKYDAITETAAKTSNAFGPSLANSIAYGVPEGTLNAKTRLGFPNKCTPVINKNTGALTSCSKYIIKRG